MRNPFVFSLALATGLVALGGGQALAQETVSQSGGIGVGVQQMLLGPAGVSFTFDGGAWHADAILNAANEPTRFGLGARGWFHLHSGQAADFSVGGGLGFQHQERGGIAGDADIISIDLGMLLRAFVVSNVALSAFGGVAILTGDDDRFALTGQFVGAFGITYFFR